MSLESRLTARSLADVWAATPPVRSVAFWLWLGLVPFAAGILMILAGHAAMLVAVGWLGGYVDSPMVMRPRKMGEP